MAVIEGVCRIVGGVDTHKDLHVAAIVDEQDRIIGTQSFATTRQGYRQMLAWMRSFGVLQRIGIESTGSYGAGLLRFMQQAKVTVLEVTTPDKQDRRRRGKNDDLDAQNAAHAAFAGQRTVTPRSRDGMIESLRVLKACRKTAVSARRIALQMIHNTIVCAPDGLRDQLRRLTRMQLIRTLASWRPDLTAYRDLDSAYRIGLKSLARRYLELHDEIADLDAMIAKGGGRAVALKGDVAIEADAVAMFDAAAKALGPLTAVIANAGIVAPTAKLADMSAERMRRIFEVNVRGGCRNPPAAPAARSC